MHSRPFVSVIIPAYQEAGSVDAVVQSVRRALTAAGYAHEIVVVDDGSRDGTSAALRPSAGLKILRHTRNRGYGAAIKSGLRVAGGEWIGLIDGDETYPAERMPQLLEQLQTHAMAVAVREDGGGGPWPRRWGREVLRALAQHLAGCRIPDLNSGLRAFRRDEILPYVPIFPNGFSLTSTVTLALLCNDRRVAFLATPCYPRRHGRSKIRPVRDMLRFTWLLGRVTAYFHPLRVFAPLALLTFVVAVLLVATHRPALTATGYGFALSSALLLGCGWVLDVLVAETRGARRH